MYCRGSSISFEPTGFSSLSPALASVVLRRLLRGLESGRFVVDTPWGRYAGDSGRPGPQAHLTLHSSRSLLRFLSGGGTASRGPISSANGRPPISPRCSNLPVETPKSHRGRCPRRCGPRAGSATRFAATLGGEVDETLPHITISAMTSSRNGLTKA